MRVGYVGMSAYGRTPTAHNGRPENKFEHRDLRESVLFSVHRFQPEITAIPSRHGYRIGLARKIM